MRDKAEDTEHRDIYQAIENRHDARVENNSVVRVELARGICYVDVASDLCQTGFRINRQPCLVISQDACTEDERVETVRLSYSNANSVMLWRK